MACDMPEPSKFPSLGSCENRFLWTSKDVDPAPHPVVGLVLQGGDTEKSFLMHLISKAWILFSESASSFTAIQEDGGDKRLVELELQTCL